MDLALVELELARRGRRRHTFFLQALFPTLVLIPLTLIWLTAVGQPLGTRASELVASIIVRLGFYFRVCVVLLVIPILAAGAIAEERVQRTLPILLLAVRGSGPAVWSSKCSAATLQALVLLTGTLPMMAIAALLGGVDTVLAVTDVAVSCLSGTCVVALGVACSSFSATAAQALRRTATLLMLWIAPDVYLRLTGAKAHWHLFFFDASDADTVVSALGPSIPAFFLTVTVAVAASAAALVKIPRLIVKIESKRSPQKRRFAALPRMATSRSSVSHMVRRTPGLPSSRRLATRWMYTAVLCVLGLAGFPLATLVAAALCVFEVHEALLYMRRTGLWDELRIAAVEEQLGDGVLRGFVWGCACYGWPMVIALLTFPGYPMVAEAPSLSHAWAVVPGLVALGVMHLRFVVYLAVFHSWKTRRKILAMFPALFTLILSMVLWLPFVYGLMELGATWLGFCVLAVSVGGYYAAGEVIKVEFLSILRIWEPLESPIVPVEEWTHSGRLRRTAK